MARVIDTSGLPSVMPDVRPPQDYQNINPSADSFGALPAAAQQHAGAQMEQGSNELASAAIEKQSIFNQIASDDAFNKLQKGYLDTTYGDPNDPAKPGFYSMRGQDAMSGYQPAIKSMSDLRNQISQGLPNDRVRLEFDTASRRLETFTREAMGRHYDQQLNVYGIATQKASIDNAAQAAALNFNDDTAFQHNLAEAQRGAVRMSQSAGAPEGSPIYQQNVQDATSAVVKSRALAMSTSDPAGALQLVETYRPLMREQDYAALQTHLKGKADAAAGQQMFSQWQTGSAPSTPRASATPGGASVIPPGWTPAAYPNAPTELQQELSSPERTTPATYALPMPIRGSARRPSRAMRSRASTR